MNTESVRRVVEGATDQKATLVLVCAGWRQVIFYSRRLGMNLSTRMVKKCFPLR